MLRVLAFSSMLLIAAAAPEKEAPAGVAPWAPASMPASQPYNPGDSVLHWRLTKGTPLVYDLRQTIKPQSSAQTTAVAPIEIEGAVEISPIDDKLAHYLVRAARTQPPLAPPPPTAPAKPAGCSCRRVGSTQAQPATQPAPPPEPPRGMVVALELQANGALTSGRRAAGGESELMARLLMPLPEQPIKLGETVTAPMTLDGAAGRYPIGGNRALTYVREEVVDGRRCAVLRHQAELRGESPGQAQLEGKISVRADGEGLFDIEAGHYLRATSHVWFQMNTARMENGKKSAITVEQDQESTVTLRSAQPASSPTTLPR